MSALRDNVVISPFCGLISGTRLYVADNPDYPMSVRSFFTTADNNRCVDCLSTDIIHVPPTAPFCLECGNYVNQNWLGV